MKINYFAHILKIIFIIFISLLSSPLYALEENPYSFTSAADEKRFLTLSNEVRCVVCQNQTIAESNAPLATDIRTKIYRMILDKKSDAEIKDYLVKRYTEFILLEPRFNKLTYFLWLFPAFGLVFIFYFIFRRARQG